MNLKDIYAVKIPRRRKRRVGRGGGSGVGGTSGRGHKGAHSRAGWGGHIMREGGQMPLVRRVPTRSSTCGTCPKFRPGPRWDRFSFVRWGS